jgi:hypothetical protein
MIVESDIISAPPPASYLSGSQSGYHPLIALLMFIPLFLNTNLGLSRSVSQLVFHYLKDTLSRALDLDESAKRTVLEQLEHLPQNFGSLYETFGFNHTDIQYINCPKCRSLYHEATFLPVSPCSDSSMQNPLPSHPPPKPGKSYIPLEVPGMDICREPWGAALQYRCTYRSRPDQNPCNEMLMQARSSDTKEQQAKIPRNPAPQTHMAKSPLVPRLTFMYRSLLQFLTKIVTQPGMVALLSASLHDKDSMETATCEAEVSDIMDSASIRSMKAADQTPFAVRLHGELRICLGLFIDWYNARGNSIRGGKHSTGGIYIVILNLPLHLRYKKEYMYQLFIPGPREPNTQGINHYMRPLINDLIILFNDGFKFFITSWFICRAALAIIIADLLAAKKICGFAAVNHRWFCPYCRCPEEEIASSLCEPSKLSASVTRQAYLDITKAWRDASTEKGAEAIFERWGFRYTELARLESFDILKHTVIEGFHALLPNVAQPHCRTLMGIREQNDSMAVEKHVTGDDEDEPSTDEDGIEDDPDGDVVEGVGASVTTDMLHTALMILRRPQLDPTALRQLERMPNALLLELCHRKELPPWRLPHHGQSPSKAGMVLMLVDWVCNYSFLFGVLACLII